VGRRFQGKTKWDTPFRTAVCLAEDQRVDPDAKLVRPPCGITSEAVAVLRCEIQVRGCFSRRTVTASRHGGGVHQSNLFEAVGERSYEMLGGGGLCGIIRREAFNKAEKLRRHNSPDRFDWVNSTA